MATTKKKTTFNLECASAAINEQVEKLVQEAARKADRLRHLRHHNGLCTLTTTY